jgi:thioredoxin 1
MKTSTFRPIFVPSKTAVLLAFIPTGVRQQELVDYLLERVDTILGDSIRITRVNQDAHPEVVKSFGIQEFPAFVLLKQGTEVGRFDGIAESAELIRLLSQKLREEAR